jgi:hypothetical protein
MQQAGLLLVVVSSTTSVAYVMLIRGGAYGLFGWPIVAPAIISLVSSVLLITSSRNPPIRTRVWLRALGALSIVVTLYCVLPALRF